MLVCISCRTTAIGESSVKQNSNNASPITFDSIGNITAASFAPIRDAIGLAKFIAFGEDGHLSAGMMGLYFSLAEHLVVHYGFRVLAFESDYFATDLADDYIHGGSTTLIDAIQSFGQYRTSTKEVIEFLNWCKKFNSKNASDSIHLAGYDHQDSYAAGNVIRSFLQNTLPMTEFKTVWKSFDSVPGASQETYGKFLAAQNSGVFSQKASDNLRAITDLYLYMASKRTEWFARGVSVDDYKRAVWALQSMEFENKKKQAYEDNLGQNALAIRDTNMAYIFLNRIASTSSKVILFGANMHVGRLAPNWQLFTTDGAPPTLFNGGSTGYQIAKALGDAYRVFPILSYDPHYLASSPSLQGRKAMQGSIQNEINSFNIPSPSFIGRDSSWFSKTTAVFDFSYNIKQAYLKLVPANYCDGYLWLQTSSAAVKVP